MRSAKSVGLLAALLLIAASAMSLVAWGEITLDKSEGAQAEWWYFEEGGVNQICDATQSPSCAVPYGNHWSVELGTHVSGDWAYVQLDAGGRMTLSELTELGFRYKENTSSASAPSMALVLQGGDLAISEHPAPVSGTCTNVDATSLNWWYGTWNGSDPSTLTLSAATPIGAPITFAALKAGVLQNKSVLAVMVLSNVVGDKVGSPGGVAPIATSTAVVDRVRLEWVTAAVAYGGYYNLEPEWPFDVVAGEDVGDGVYDFDDNEIPAPQYPAQYDHWCTDDTYCSHCQPVDDENLWTIVFDSNLPSSVPSAVKPFSSPHDAIYFGKPMTGTYKTSERAVGTICSPYNELNPADRYVSIEFDNFRQVENYPGGEYDWTYVQIQFVDDQGNPVWPAYGTGPTGWFDPFDYSQCAGGPAPTTHYVNGDVEPHPSLYNRNGTGCYDSALYASACFPVNPTASQLRNTGWKTVWYKDSTDASSTAWQHVEITHYLDTDNQPYDDDEHKILIPPGATRMRIRFGFNTVDGSSNNYFGWIVDNIEKHHSYDAPGCTICTTSLPQGRETEKYGDVYQDGTYFLLCPSGNGARWELVSVLKGDQRLTDLPGRLALDAIGKIYGTPDPGTSGSYEVTLRLLCENGGTDYETFMLNITPPQGQTPASQIGQIEHFGPTQGQPSLWINEELGAALPGAGSMGCGDENLWHQTSNVKYALGTADLQADLGTVAYFGLDDLGRPSRANDPNYDCGNRLKGCMYNPYGSYVVTDANHVGQELIIGFKSWRMVEDYPGGHYDKTWVSVRINSGAPKVVWERDSSTPSDAAWRWEEAKTGIILKKGDKITVQFCFDSVDGYNNGTDGTAWGWLVDEVTLLAGSSSLSIVKCPPNTASAGESYNEEVRASGGPAGATIEWSIAAGTNLPPGLDIQVDGSNSQVAHISGVPREAGDYSFQIVAKIRSGAGQQMATADCRITVGRDVTLLDEDFEADPTWSKTGLWRITGPKPTDPVTTVSDINEGSEAELGDGNHAAYYGRTAGADYNTGGTTGGALTLLLPVVNLTSAEAFTVTFDQWRSVESFPAGGDFDQTLVQVQLGDGTWQTIWRRTSHDPSVKEWTTETVGPFLTNGASTMLIRFVFDSVDKWYNNFTGWLVDNIRIESASAANANPLSLARIDDARTMGRNTPVELQVMNVPNPVTDVHTTTFMVRSVDVEAMKIAIYDLAGNKVYEEEVQGNELVWHTDNDYGEFLANGIYLYRAYVLVDGVWVETTVQKLVILR